MAPEVGSVTCPQQVTLVDEDRPRPGGDPVLADRLDDRCTAAEPRTSPHGNAQAAREQVRMVDRKPGTPKSRAPQGPVRPPGGPGSKSDDQGSPTAGDGKLSVMNFDANGTVIQPGGSEFTRRPTANFNDDGDRTRHRASVAISPGNRFVRTGTKRWAVGKCGRRGMSRFRRRRARWPCAGPTRGGCVPPALAAASCRSGRRARQSRRRPGPSPCTRLGRAARSWPVGRC